MKKETSCVHAGTYRDAAVGGVNTPIFASSAFEYIDRAEMLYPRHFNTPNQRAVVHKLCALEGMQDGLLFSSGMAAMTAAILSQVKAGSHLVVLDSVYGGTHALASQTLAGLGVQCSFVPTDAAAVESAITAQTSAIVVESPTNPLLDVIDLRRVAQIARQRSITTIADNTFASPINQTPGGLGIDIVVHSGTKYLGGHSDLSCGVVLASSQLVVQIQAVACTLGGNVNALTCHLLERSLKTLALRVERQTRNAQHVAEYLAGQPTIRRVNYPGLANFPGHQIAREQMTGFGAMMSFELSPEVDATQFLLRLQLIRPAVSLGGVETLICAPAQTSHARLTAAERQRIGITDSLLRLSVGVEHVDDLIADLAQAFGK
ncbi:MAG: PLP-dependent transferase [Pirellulaceae bacterium]|nr:PLP-dependent transferase [Pirellulaceae bacterium]